jgi:hypothetical protein
VRQKKECKASKIVEEKEPTEGEESDLEKRWLRKIEQQEVSRARKEHGDKAR